MFLTGSKCKFKDFLSLHLRSDENIATVHFWMHFIQIDYESENEQFEWQMSEVWLMSSLRSASLQSSLITADHNISKL